MILPGQMPEAGGRVMGLAGPAVGVESDFRFRVTADNGRNHAGKLFFGYRLSGTNSRVFLFGTMDSQPALGNFIRWRSPLLNEVGQI